MELLVLGAYLNALTFSLYGLQTAYAATVASSSQSVQWSEAEDMVRREFIDAPVMVKIARCESGTRQFNSDGTVLRGKVNSKDTGLFQVNLRYHGEAAKKMGLDVTTIDGNIAYARYLYERDGTRHWNASQGCWGK